jgi:hypothetical protein
MPIRRILPAISLLLVSCAVAPALATTAVVPDNFPTIQAGIDSWRDTVLVRGGHYDEDLVLITGVTLAVIPSEAGGDTVETGGLSIEYDRSGGVPYLPGRHLTDARGFHFAGPVRQEHVSMLDEIAFAACRMDSGLAFCGGGFCTGEGRVRIVSCTILNGVSTCSNNANLTNNTILGGGIYVSAMGTYRIQGNYVQGPAAYGIRTWTEGEGFLENNTVIGADVGVDAGWGGPLYVRDNTIADCSGSGLVARGPGHYSGNVIRNCGGYGIVGGAGLIGNTILACQSGGIKSSGALWGNVVGRCGGPGVEVIVAGVGGSIERNTTYQNAGPGFSLTDGSGSIANNIALGNSGPGLLWTGSTTPDLACNDWFANAGGATSGALPGATDLAVDPLFCGADSDDVRLSAGSPLLDAFGCGRIGALGQGCVDVPTPVLVSLATADVTADGVKLAWFMSGSESNAAIVYRSPVGGEWTRIGEVRADGTGYLRYTDPIDGTATRVGYRLGMVEAGIEGFYGETWVDLPAGNAPLTFALDPVRPNPSRGGALTVRFSLPTAAPARLELLDVAGRRIASHEVGVGQHTLDLGTGQHLAPGLYLVRLTQGANTRTTRVAVIN